jgi:hypothetical protein
MAPQQHSNSPPDTGPTNGHVWQQGAVRMLSHRSERPFGTAEQSLAQSGYEPQWVCLFLSEPHRQDCQCDNSTAHRKIRCQYCEACITMTGPVLLGVHRFTALTAALFIRSSPADKFLVCFGKAAPSSRRTYKLRSRN